MKEKITLEMQEDTGEARMRVSVTMGGERWVSHTLWRLCRGAWVQQLVNEGMARALDILERETAAAPAEVLELVLGEDTAALHWERRGAKHHVKRRIAGGTAKELMETVNGLLAEFLADPSGMWMLEAGRC